LLLVVSTESGVSAAEINKKIVARCSDAISAALKAENCYVWVRLEGKLLDFPSNATRLQAG
jgi:hypothetical protein